MSVTTLARLWLVILLYGGKESQPNGADVPRQSVNADIISLEEHGIVLKPGRLMSTSDVTHIQQGFVMDIPNKKARTDSYSIADNLCHQVLAKSHHTTKYYQRVCDTL